MSSYKNINMSKTKKHQTSISQNNSIGSTSLNKKGTNSTSVEKLYGEGLCNNTQLKQKNLSSYKGYQGIIGSTIGTSLNSMNLILQSGSTSSKGSKAKDGNVNYNSNNSGKTSHQYSKSIHSGVINISTNKKVIGNISQINHNRAPSHMSNNSNKSSVSKNYNNHNNYNDSEVKVFKQGSSGKSPYYSKMNSSKLIDESKITAMNISKNKQKSNLVMNLKGINNNDNNYNNNYYESNIINSNELVGTNIKHNNSKSTSTLNNFVNSSSTNRKEVYSKPQTVISTRKNSKEKNKNISLGKYPKTSGSNQTSNINNSSGRVYQNHQKNYSHHISSISTPFYINESKNINNYEKNEDLNNDGDIFKLSTHRQFYNKNEKINEKVDKKTSFSSTKNKVKINTSKHELEKNEFNNKIEVHENPTKIINIPNSSALMKIYNKISTNNKEKLSNNNLEREIGILNNHVNVSNSNNINNNNSSQVMSQNSSLISSSVILNKKSNNVNINKSKDKYGSKNIKLEKNQNLNNDGSKQKNNLFINKNFEKILDDKKKPNQIDFVNINVNNYKNNSKQILADKNSGSKSTKYNGSGNIFNKKNSNDTNYIMNNNNDSHLTNITNNTNNTNNTNTTKLLYNDKEESDINSKSIESLLRTERDKKINFSTIFSKNDSGNHNIVQDNNESKKNSLNIYNNYSNNINKKTIEVKDCSHSQSQIAKFINKKRDSENTEKLNHNNDKINQNTNIDKLKIDKTDKTDKMIGEKRINNNSQEKLKYQNKISTNLISSTGNISNLYNQNNNSKLAVKNSINLEDVRHVKVKSTSTNHNNISNNYLNASQNSGINQSYNYNNIIQNPISKDKDSENTIIKKIIKQVNNEFGINNNILDESLVSIQDRDENIFKRDSERISLIIKNYYKQTGEFPSTNLEFYKIGRVSLFQI